MTVTDSMLSLLGHENMEEDIFQTMKKQEQYDRLNPPLRFLSSAYCSRYRLALVQMIIRVCDAFRFADGTAFQACALLDRSLMCGLPKLKQSLGHLENEQSLYPLCAMVLLFDFAAFTLCFIF